MGVPVPGMIEERLLQAERLVNTAAWNDQKLAEVVAGVQQYLEDIPPPSPAGSGCVPTLTVHCLYPDGTIDPGSTVTVINTADGSTIATATANASGIATFATGIANKTVRVTLVDSRGCFNFTAQTLSIVCTNVSITLQLVPSSRTFTLTIQACGSINSPAAGATVSLYRPDGTFVATATANSSGVATITTTAAWQKGNYSAVVSGAGLVTGTFTVPSPGCTGLSQTIHATNSTVYYKFLVNACNSCPQPGITVALKDSTGAVLGTAVSDSTGTATIAAPTTASTPLTYSATHVDFATNTGTVTGSCSLSYVNGTGCTCTMGITMQVLANHYCYGGVQPPGATGPVPAAVHVTLPNDTDTFGTLAGQTVTCNFLDINGGNIRYWSSCLPTTRVGSSGLSVFVAAAVVKVALPSFNCGANVSGLMSFNIHTQADCSDAETQNFIGSATGKIWAPIAFGGTYTNSKGTYSWSVSE